VKLEAEAFEQAEALDDLEVRLDLGGLPRLASCRRRTRVARGDFLLLRRGLETNDPVVKVDSRVGYMARSGPITGLPPAVAVVAAGRVPLAVQHVLWRPQTGS